MFLALWHQIKFKDTYLLKFSLHDLTIIILSIIPVKVNYSIFKSLLIKFTPYSNLNFEDFKFCYRENNLLWSPIRRDCFHSAIKYFKYLILSGINEF